jgi:ubiquinone/menaquinone biosynthesis C-methylase UbiE
LLKKVITRHFGQRADLKALDVGCGVGKFHSLLSAHVHELHGTDVSQPCLDQARTAHPNVSYTPYDGHRLPYPDGHFDVTLTVCVMHHVPPAQWREFVMQMRRVTKSGGVIAIIEHNPFNPLTRLAVSRCPFDHDAVLLRSGQVENLLDGAGCTQIHSRFFLLFPSAHRIVRAVEEGFSCLPFGAQYMVTGQVA